MLLQDFVRTVNSIFPFSTAVEGDNVGLQIASRRGEVQRILVTLEITDNVLTEARLNKIDTILTFHPLIFSPLTTITGADRVSRLVLEIVSSDIAVICVHTAFDVYPQGTNHLLANKIDLEVIDVLDPVTGGIGSGIGVIAKTKRSVNYRTFVQTVTDVCGGVVRYSPSVNDAVTLVAIVAGSGISWYNNAVQAKVDVFITADVKYHAFHAAVGTVGLIDVGHYEMEQFVTDGIANELRSVLKSEITLMVSAVNTNPIKYCTPLTN